MVFETYRMVNQEVMYIEEMFDSNGKRCATIKETGQFVYVDMSPLTLINASLRSIGYDLKSAQASAKWIIGLKQLGPFMVNPIHNICLFPHKLTKKGITIWFNPAQIKRTGSFNRKTKIEFINGETLVVEGKVTTFNNKLIKAEQLRRITMEIAQDPLSYTIDPQKEQLQYRKNKKEEEKK